MGTQHNKKQKSCLKFLGTVFSFLFLLSLIFYFVYWRVPDPGDRMKILEGPAEERARKQVETPREKNGWYDYKKAAEKIDVSFLFANKLSSYNHLIHPPEYNYALSKQINTREMLHYVTRYVGNDKDIDKIEKTLKENSEVFDIVDKGFTKELFFDENDYFWTTYLTNKKRAVAEVAEGYNGDVDISSLYMLLRLSGDFEKNRGKPLTAARRYLELHRLNEYDSVIYLAVCPPGDIYVTVLKSLLLLITDNMDNKELCEYVSFNMDRIEQGDFRIFLMLNYLTIQYYFESQDSHFSFVDIGYSVRDYSRRLAMKRELKVDKNLLIKTIEEYQQNPYNVMEICDKYNNLRSQSLSNKILEVQTYYTPFAFCYRRTFLNGVKIAAAIGLYKADRGKFPESLEELEPDYIKKLPMDYFSKDHHFCYKNRNGKPLLYSVGPDGIDEKGQQEFSWDLPFGGGDIILIDFNRKENKSPESEVEKKGQ